MDDKQIYRGDWYDPAYAAFFNALVNIKKHNEKNEKKLLGFFGIDDARIEVEKSLAAIIGNFSCNHFLAALKEAVTNIINDFKKNGKFGVFGGKYQTGSFSLVLKELNALLEELNKLDAKDEIDKETGFVKIPRS